jgi:hypothetical protein
MREKLRVAVVSAALTALRGSLLTQYIQYVNRKTVAGVAVSLQIVFAAIAGGMHVLLGPTVGALFTIVLNEALRIVFGTHFHRRRQHDLWHPPDPLHHLHAARHRRSRRRGFAYTIRRRNGPLRAPMTRSGKSLRS